MQCILVQFHVYVKPQVSLTAEKSDTEDGWPGQPSKSTEVVLGGQRNQLRGESAKLHITAGTAPVTPAAAWRFGASI